MHKVLVIIFLCAIASVHDALGRQSAFDPPSTESRPFTDTDLRAMRDAARDALFAMQDGEKHWQPQFRRLLAGTRSAIASAAASASHRPASRRARNAQHHASRAGRCP